MKKTRVSYNKKGTKKQNHHKTQKNAHATRKKKNLKSAFLNQVRCSPKTQRNGFSCFGDDDLNKLKNLWNARHSDTKILTNDSKEIWTNLKQNMSNVCNKESCWLKQQFMDNSKIKKELTNAFAPEAPKNWKKNPNEWLSGMDILNVMKQYEKTYKCFDFIGPSPIDFDTIKMYGECVWEELCHFNLEKEIKKGKFKIGVIFNLDPHTKGGSHWVSLFINVKKASIFYFDSAGESIPRRIKKFVKRVTSQGTQLKTPIDFHFDQNHPTEHQYGDTECGIYSLYFIAHMLEDKHTENYFKTHILSDKYMEQFRKVYFNQGGSL